MKSIILKSASNYLLPLLLLFSVFILLRGHYQPGGGFVGGLIASVAFVLHAFANGLEKTKEFLKYHPGVFTLIFVPDLFIQNTFLGIAAATLLTGALGALVKLNIRRIFSYLIVCHIGYMIAGLGLFTEVALKELYFILFTI